MTSPSAFLYKYTPGSVGIVRILASRSMARRDFLFYWMGLHRDVLQKGQMPQYSRSQGRAVLRSRALFVTIAALLVSLQISVQIRVFAQNNSTNQSLQPQITKSEEGK